MGKSTKIPEASEVDVAGQPQIFVSYARQDADRVLAVARLLDENGASVWRDEERILGGQYYGEQIVHAIAHSKVVMLMCSPQAFLSDNVHREVLLTWDHYHRHYLPVWLCPPMEIPERFRYALVGCQWIDVHSQPTERWLPKLLNAPRAVGVETTKPGGPPPDEATPRSVDVPVEAARRQPRFKPGDRPIQGADWVVERLLGKGGFGEVWKARNPQLARMAPVALKFCLELDDRSRELLRHEADMVLQAQAQIRSDGIVPLLHAYLNNDPPCLEFPYIEGGTLVRLFDECREKAGTFSPAQAQRIIHRLAQIVAPAHRATPRLIHRDLKPSNVLVERRADGKIVLPVTDFGIGAIAAQPVLERSRATGSLEGSLSSVLTGAYSPLYASPQQMQGDKADPRDDVYALGVIWYQLLKGDLSSPAPTGRRWMEVLRGRGMSNAAVELLSSSCFESDPAYRPAAAGMLAGQLQALAPAPAERAATASPPEYITTIASRIKLRLIPAGEFMMGSDASDPDAYDDEFVDKAAGRKEKRRVRITQPFYLGVTEVTRGQFREFVDDASYKTEAEKDGNGGYGWNEQKGEFEQDPKFTWQNAGFDQTDDHPVVNVSWNDAVALCEWLSRKDGKTYHLPTEAEWEYACRTETKTRYFCGDDPEGLAAFGNVADGTAKEKYPSWTTIAARDGYVYTAPVGRCNPNAWGLYDMHGNVWEWCSDGYDADYYKRSPVDDPRGAEGAANRVARGGCWGDGARGARSAGRGRGEPGGRSLDLGFRVARVQSGR